MSVNGRYNWSKSEFIVKNMFIFKNTMQISEKHHSIEWTSDELDENNLMQLKRI